MGLPMLPILKFQVIGRTAQVGSQQQSCDSTAANVTLPMVFKVKRFGTFSFMIAQPRLKAVNRQLLLVI
jgi:hypothetical protein